MKNITLFALLFLTGVYAVGQNLIGYNDEEIKKYMKENCKEMNFEKVTNSIFRYLKYSDNSNSQTLLLFLNPNSVCKSVRMICDVNAKTEKVKEFNSLYKRSGENKWLDLRAGKVYIIEIKEEKWSCIISIEPDK